MKNNTFNADAYVAAATIIPVLFLAIAVQGSFLNEYIDQWRKAVKKSSSLTTFMVPYSFVIIILGVGYFGETSAVIALFDRQANSFTEELVRFSIGALLAFVIFPPASKFARTIREILTDVTEDSSSQPDQKEP